MGGAFGKNHLSLVVLSVSALYEKYKDFSTKSSKI